MNTCVVVDHDLCIYIHIMIYNIYIYLYTVYIIIYPYVFFGGVKGEKAPGLQSSIQLFFFPASPKRRFLEDFNGFLISEGFMHESKFPKIHIFEGQQTSPHRSGGWNHE